MRARTRATKARKPYRQTPEGAVLHSILDYLLIKKILCFRMQTGAHVASYGGRTRMIRYGTPGMADVLAFPVESISFNPGDEMADFSRVVPFWVEVKSAVGRQSPDQVAFQKIVEDSGHWYLTARSIDDVENFLKERGVIR